MSDRSKEVTAFINKHDGWRKEVLQSIRRIAHSLDHSVTESLKWGAPHFDHHGIMVGMMTFKKHVNIFFHKGALLDHEHGLFGSVDTSKGSRSIKIHEQDDLNEKVIQRLFNEACELNQKGVKLSDAKPARRLDRISPELKKMINSNPAARKCWESLPPSHKREYIEWIEEAKKESTKQRRLTKALIMLSEGKGLNDKYR